VSPSQRRSAAPAPPPVVRLLPQLADFAARQYGDTPFLLRSTPEGWQGYTFAAFAQAVHSFRAMLVELGVRPGERVGLQSENRPEWGVAYMAILSCDAVVVPLDAQLKAHEVGEILSTAGAGRCIVSARQHPVLEQVREQRLPGLELIGLDPLEGLRGLHEAMTRHAGAGPAALRAQPGDLAVLIFTSGTTGQAKGVMLSHSNLLHNVEAVARTFDFSPADRLLSVLPLHHTFESTGGLLVPMRVGASVAYARSLDSKGLREDMASSGATLFVGVPLLYEKLLTAIHRRIAEAPLPRKLLANGMLLLARTVRVLTGVRVGRGLFRPLREKAGMGRLRLFITGAAPMAPDVFWGLTDLGWTVLEGYGLTETSPIVCGNRPPKPGPGAVGAEVPGVEVRIVDPDGDGDGEIAVRGPNVMLGYYGNPQLTAEVLKDGWFYTGDLGRRLPDGRIRITGRLKNMIATAAGKKIYPEEIEVQLLNSPYVLEVVVVGGRDPRGEREEVHAHIHPNLQALETHARETGRTCDQAFVESTLRHDVDMRCAMLAPYKKVKRIVVRREEFPKTTTGKIKRQDLAAEAAVGRASAVA
jgi:long-chain acyl-CoA synthetase